MKRRWRTRFWTLLLAWLMLAVSLSGCGPEEGASSEESQAPAAEGSSLFAFDPAEIRSIELCSSGNIDSSIELENRWQIQDMVELINGFTYTSSKEIPPSSGWSYRITLHTDTWSEGFTFQPESNSVLLDSTLYYGPEGYFQELGDITDGRVWLHYYDLDPEDISSISFDKTIGDREDIETVVEYLNGFTYRTVADSVPEEERHNWMHLQGPDGSFSLCFGSYFIRDTSGPVDRFYCGERDYFAPLLEFLREAEDSQPETTAPAPGPTATPQPARSNPLFQLEEGQVKAMRIRRCDPRAETVELTGQELQDAIVLLNGFTYEEFTDETRSSTPFPMEYAYELEIEERDGELTCVTLGSRVVEEELYNNTVLYTGEEDYFRPLLNLADAALLPAGTPLLHYEAEKIQSVRFSLSHGEFMLTDREEIEKIVELLNAFPFESAHMESELSAPPEETHSIFLWGDPDGAAEDILNILEVTSNGISYYAGHGTDFWLFGEEGYFDPLIQWEERFQTDLPCELDPEQVTEIQLYGDGKSTRITKPEEIQRAVELFNTFTPTESRTVEELDRAELLSFWITVENELGTLMIRGDFDGSHLCQDEGGGAIVHTGQPGHFDPLLALYEDGVPL